MNQESDRYGAGLLLVRQHRSEDLQILLGRRTRRFCRGKLANPWGRLKRGEALCDCAVRETAEEAGDWVRGTRVKEWRDLRVPGVMHYRCGLVVLDDKVQPPDVFTCHELSEMGWYSLSDLLQQKKDIFPITRHWLYRFGVYRSMR